MAITTATIDITSADLGISLNAIEFAISVINSNF